MELRSKSIKLFCSVVESGSLLSASNKLNISTSAASRIISQLEDRLGFALFDRSNKNLTLTPEGNEFYRVALDAMKSWRLLEDYSLKQKSKRKLLRAAVLARHCSDVILPAIVKIMKKHENTLKVSIDVHQSRDIHYSKYSHPFDIGFGTLLSDHDDLHKEVLAYLPFRLVVSNLNPLSLKDVVKRSDYADEDFICLVPDTKERYLSDQLLPHLNENQIVAEVSSTQVALRMVKRNVGVHITDLLAAISVSSDCKAIELDDPLTIPFYAFWPTGITLSKEARECVAEIARSIKNVGIELTEQGKSYLSEH